MSDLIDLHADRIERHDDGSVSVTLRSPLKTKDGDLGFLPLSRPDFDGLLGQERQPGDSMDKAGWLIARLTGVEVGAFDTIDAEDGMLLSELVGEFLGQSDDGESLRIGSRVERHADRIARTDSDATLTLLRPLATKDGPVGEITLRRPTWKEMKASKASTLAANAKLMATLSGVGPLALGKLDALDALVLVEIISGFLGNSRRTGGA